MKRSRFTEEQITYAPLLADSGTQVVDVCRHQTVLSSFVLGYLDNHLST